MKPVHRVYFPISWRNFGAVVKLVGYNAGTSDFTQRLDFRLPHGPNQSYHEEFDTKRLLVPRTAAPMFVLPYGHASCTDLRRHLARCTEVISPNRFKESCGPCTVSTS